MSFNVNPEKNASVPAAITYTRTDKHSKDVTRHIKPNLLATPGV